MRLMRTLDQPTMNRVFAVTDEVPIDREALQVALVLEGEGKVEPSGNGRTGHTGTSSSSSSPRNWCSSRICSSLHRPGR